MAHPYDGIYVAKPLSSIDVTRSNPRSEPGCWYANVKNEDLRRQKIAHGEATETFVAGHQTAFRARQEAAVRLKCGPDELAVTPTDDVEATET